MSDEKQKEVGQSFVVRMKIWKEQGRYATLQEAKKEAARIREIAEKGGECGQLGIGVGWGTGFPEDPEVEVIREKQASV